MNPKILAQILLVVSVSTALAALLDEENRTLWFVTTVLSHVALVAAGASYFGGRRGDG